MPLYSNKPKDGLTDAVDRLRAELSVINEELRVIEMRKPALESRAQRIGEALQTLIGDGSTGDPRWMQMPRIGEGGLVRDEQPSIYAEEPRHRILRPKHQIGPVKKPEITEEAIIAMAEYSEKVGHPVKSAELYEHLVSEGLLEPIETEMPYKSFAITLRNIPQDFIEYDRATKTWSQKDRSPRAKLREALEKGDGTRVVSSNAMGVAREDHPFVKAVNSVFKANRWEPLSASRLYDELSERPNFGLIPGVGSVAELATSLSNYKDFYQYEDSTNTYKALKQESARPEIPAGVPGLYTVRSNNGVTV